MHSSLFFRLFPPPRFLMMPHAGLDISDEALRFVEYRQSRGNLSIFKYDIQELPAGLIDGGEIKDSKTFVEVVAKFAKKNRIIYAKISLPEEKCYFFQTDIPSRDISAVNQNIEFKLEENVPLPAGEAIFCFDILPVTVSGASLKASVSVAPRPYVETLVGYLRQAGIVPLAFEVSPKAIARSISSAKNPETVLVLHAMKKKIGFYIVSNGVVCFSSTIVSENPDRELIKREITRVNQYWTSRPEQSASIAKIVCLGSQAGQIELALKEILANSQDGQQSVSAVNIWSNILGTDKIVPENLKNKSLEFAVAAGLALPM